MISTSFWNGPLEEYDGGLAPLLWGLGALVLCMLAVTNFRGYTDWLARRSRSFKTHRQAFWFQRCFSAVFAVAAMGAITLGVYRIAQGHL